MELKDTVNGMLSSNYFERFEAEYQQLVIRSNKLEKFIMRVETEGAKHDCPIGLLKRQLEHMKEYMYDLKERMIYEGEVR